MHIENKLIPALILTKVTTIAFKNLKNIDDDNENFKSANNENE